MGNHITQYQTFYTYVNYMNEGTAEPFKDETVSVWLKNPVRTMQ
jgi:hypothetical protein